MRSWEHFSDVEEAGPVIVHSYRRQAQHPFLSPLYKLVKEFQALKYTTTFPVILLSALKYHVELEFWFSRLRPLWVLCAVLNSCYSFYWDITKDWDLGWLSGPCRSRKQCLRPTLLYNRPWVYYWAIGSNMVLRGAWTYKLSAHLRHNFKTVFFFSLLEMLRRFQWVFFRVEIAAIKVSTTNASNNSPPVRVNSQIPLKELPAESERFLAAPEYNV